MEKVAMLIIGAIPAALWSRKEGARVTQCPLPEHEEYSSECASTFVLDLFNGNFNRVGHRDIFYGQSLFATMPYRVNSRFSFMNLVSHETALAALVKVRSIWTR